MITIINNVHCVVDFLVSPYKPNLMSGRQAPIRLPGILQLDPDLS